MVSRSTSGELSLAGVYSIMYKEHRDQYVFEQGKRYWDICARQTKKW